MLLESGNYERIDVAESRRELLQYISAFRYDAVLIDTRLDSMEGIELMKQIKAQRFDQKIIIIGNWKGEFYFQQALMQGLKGYILRNSSLKELNRGIQAVIQGGEFFTREISSRLIKMAIQPPRDSQTTVHEILTERELEVLKRVVKEYDNSEIAAEMQISISMVKKYRASLMVKTNSRNTVGLVLFALKSGIIEQSSEEI